MDKKAVEQKRPLLAILPAQPVLTSTRKRLVFRQSLTPRPVAQGKPDRDNGERRAVDLGGITVFDRSIWVRAERRY